MRPFRGMRDAAAATLFLALTVCFTGLIWGLAAVSPQEWSEFPTVLAYVLGGAGPLLVAAAMVHARIATASPREFWVSTIDPRRVPPVWYAVILAVGFGPGLIALLAPGSSDKGDSDVAFVALLLVAVLAGFAEEPGWRGFGLDRLSRAVNPTAAALTVGLAWTLWHLPLYFIAGTVQQEAGLWSSDFSFDMTARIPLAVVFAGVYFGAGRSIFSAVLLHAVDNIASVTLDPTGPQLWVRLAVQVALALAVSLWLARRWSAHR